MTGMRRQPLLRKPATNPTPPRSGRGGGFTLVEMLIVVTMIGLLMTVGYTYLQGQVPYFQLKSSAESLVRALDRARGEAMTGRGNTTVVFENASNAPHKLCARPVNGSPGCASAFLTEFVPEHVIVQLSGPNEPAFDSKGRLAGFNDGQQFVFTLTSDIQSKLDRIEVRVNRIGSTSVQYVFPQD